MPTEELVKAVPPQALLINRMMVDTVVEAPNGAHFTTAAPDYGRDEKFQRHYAEAAGSDETWQQFVQTYLSGSEADYQAAVRKFAEAQKEAPSDLREPAPRCAPSRARSCSATQARSWSARWRTWCRSAPGWRA